MNPTTPSLIPIWEHAQSRYQCVSSEVIHILQTDFFIGYDLEDSIPDMDLDTASVIVAETIEADILWNMDTADLFKGKLKHRRKTDFQQAALAEVFKTLADYAERRGNQKEYQTYWALEMATLEELAKTPTASPLLDYCEIYFDLAEASRDEKNKHAIQWTKRRLAHDLKYNDAVDTPQILRDLADFYLETNNFEQGLKIITAMLQYDPADIWAYNHIAINGNLYGLDDFGRQAIQRGQDLIKERGDEEGLAIQFEKILRFQSDNEEKKPAPKVNPKTLAELQQALQLDFSAAQTTPLVEVCRRLLPDFDKIPVKRPATAKDYPLPKIEEVRPVLEEIQKAKSFFGRVGKIFRRN